MTLTTRTLAVVVSVLGSLASVAAFAAPPRPSIAELQAQIATLQTQVIPNMAGYVSMDLSTPTRPVLRVAGANLQVVSGTGSTAGTINGLGNVIIGYNENSGASPPICSDGAFSTQPTCLSPAVWGANQHTGSHNLVIGSGHSYTSYGGLVAGNENAINRNSASVTGGRANIASGQFASVSAGGSNVAQGDYSSISAGSANKALASFTSVSGGGSNTATAPVNGSGQFVGFGSSVSGGYNNLSAGDLTSVSGGGSNSAITNQSSISGGEGNVTGGFFTSISGGDHVSYGVNRGWAGGLLNSP